jgi:hypothetical protein
LRKSFLQVAELRLRTQKKVARAHLWQTHLRHLEAFFNALATSSLAINLEKCVFAAPSLEIFGHTISATGAAPTAHHAAEIKKCPPPQDIKQLQRFLGMVNFYRRFLPNCAQVLKPLTDLLKGGAKTLQWTATAQEDSREPSASWRRRCHFNTLPQMLSFLSPLTPPILTSEGSCSKKPVTHWQPLGFFSRKLTDTESRYSTFDRELLAAQTAIKHFRHFCEGHLFQL